MGPGDRAFGLFSTKRRVAIGAGALSGWGGRLLQLAGIKIRTVRLSCTTRLDTGKARLRGAVWAQASGQEVVRKEGALHGVSPYRQVPVAVMPGRSFRIRIIIIGVSDVQERKESLAGVHVLDVQI
jgi:hypothetical protein